jgi:GAF domain-containing protein
VTSVVGVLSMWRTEGRPVQRSATWELLDEFAAQAAIALQQVDLMQALEARSTELAEQGRPARGAAEVGEAVSSSLDPDAVLASIVSNAVQLTDADGGSILEYEKRRTPSSSAPHTGAGRRSWTPCGRTTIHGTPPSSAGQ